MSSLCPFAYAFYVADYRSEHFMILIKDITINRLTLTSFWPISYFSTCFNTKSFDISNLSSPIDKDESKIKKRSNCCAPQKLESVGQEHWCPPLMLVHMCEHPPLFSSHSFTSNNESKIINFADHLKGERGSIEFHW